MKLTKKELRSLMREDLFKVDKGLGDTISRTINLVTLGKINPCGGCNKRKEYLNKKFPYNTSKPFTP